MRMTCLKIHANMRFSPFNLSEMPLKPNMNGLPLIRPKKGNSLGGLKLIRAPDCWGKKKRGRDDDPCDNYMI